MTNIQLTLATLLILAAHLATLTAAVLKRTSIPILWLNLAVASVVLIYLALHPRWLAAPVDGQMAGLAVFEAVSALAAVMALRGVRLAGAVSWGLFGVHLLASIAAVAFALLFRITRLI